MHHFQTMDKLVGQKWGLSPQTLIRLFNQVLIPKVLYAAPIRTLRILNTLSSAINKTIKQALGVSTSSNNSMTEIFAGTPPIVLRCEQGCQGFFKLLDQVSSITNSNSSSSIKILILCQTSSIFKYLGKFKYFRMNPCNLRDDNSQILQKKLCNRTTI